MKKAIILILSSILCISVSTSSAFAGSKHQHRLEGVALGIGAVILGKAIIDNAGNQYPEEKVYHHTIIYREPPPPKRYRRGHWEIKRVWISPTYKKVFRPGHHSHRGYWVSGRWKKCIDRPGYWKEEKVWIAHHPRKKHHQMQYVH